MEWFLFLESLTGNTPIYTWEKYRLIVAPWEVNEGSSIYVVTG
jgi:hypothetical protein